MQWKYKHNEIRIRYLNITTDLMRMFAIIILISVFIALCRVQNTINWVITYAIVNTSIDTRRLLTNNNNKEVIARSCNRQRQKLTRYAQHRLNSEHWASWALVCILARGSSSWHVGALATRTERHVTGYHYVACYISRLAESVQIKYSTISLWVWLWCTNYY